MQIGVFGFDPTVEGFENSLREAAEQGFPSYWIPQIFGMDALTAIAVAASKVPEIRVGTAAPIGFDQARAKPVFFCQPLPHTGKVTGFYHQQFVARR